MKINVDLGPIQRLVNTLKQNAFKICCVFDHSSVIYAVLKTKELEARIKDGALCYKCTE